MRKIGRIVNVALVLAYFTVPAGIAAEAEPAIDDADPAGVNRLDDLFEALQAADSTDAARPIEREILDIWHSSGDPVVDRLMRRTLAAMSLRSYSLALIYLDQMVSLKPEFAEGWNKRATVYYLIDDYAKSMADIERTLALEPRHFGALAGIGMIMERIGNKQAAIDAFQKALEVNPRMDNIREEVRQLQAETAGRGI